METLQFILAVITLFISNDYTRETYLATNWREDSIQPCIVLSIRNGENPLPCVIYPEYDCTGIHKFVCNVLDN